MTVIPVKYNELVFVYMCPLSYPCSDTVGRCGMFCAIVTAIERCKTEGVVDVFQVVKALRVQKPGAVLTVVSMDATLSTVVL